MDNPPGRTLLGIFTNTLAMQETARDAHDLRKWKSEYGRLKDEVKVQERKLDDAKKSVLRRNRL